MNKSLILILIFFTLHLSFGQSINQIGLSFGITNLIGDVGSSAFNIVPVEDISFGVVYKRYRHERFSYRLGLSNLNFTADDSYGNTAKKNRSYKVRNSIRELFIGGEFNFREFRPYERKFQYAPYIVSGISFINYQSKYFENNTTVDDKLEFSAAIPIILGFKIKRKRFIFSIESGARYTFTDNLDGSKPNSEKYESFGVGDNDWYFFTNVSVLFILNRVKCFICFDS